MEEKTWNWESSILRRWCHWWVWKRPLWCDLVGRESGSSGSSGSLPCGQSLRTTSTPQLCQAGLQGDSVEKSNLASPSMWRAEADRVVGQRFIPAASPAPTALCTGCGKYSFSPSSSQQVLHPRTNNPRILPIPCDFSTPCPHLWDKLFS